MRLARVGGEVTVLVGEISLTVRASAVFLVLQVLSNHGGRRLIWIFALLISADIPGTLDS